MPYFLKTNPILAFLTFDFPTFLFYANDCYRVRCDLLGGGCGVGVGGGNYHVQRCTSGPYVLLP